MLRELVLKNRSYRRFDESYVITTDILEELVDLGRLSASAANLQPLKYIVVNDAEKRAAVFNQLAWAGYISDWEGPAEGERPGGYIVVLGDTKIAKTFGCDHGIASQSILLGAIERGLGGCLIGSVNREKLRDVLDIAEHLKILLVIALGKPAEQIVIEEAENGKIKYWRDDANIHHVPKRPMTEILIK